MIPRLHVHVPWRQIDHWLPQLLERRLQPEIGFRGEDFDPLDVASLERVAAALQQAGLAVSVHAPFMDLNPGALDPIVRDVTLRRLEQALVAARQLKARLIVIHPGYDHWHYDHQPQLWLDYAVPFFRELLPAIEQSGARVGIENIFETQPETLIQLVTALDHPLCGYCFDVGHWHLFAENSHMAGWLAPFAHKLYHLHLHDNCGDLDQHLALGQGTIDFTPLNTYLSNCVELPSMTLEAHSIEDLELSLAALPGLLPAGC
jgi:sugar phosphate isomerase/epimerase